MPVSPELAMIYASAPYDVHYIETLELQHPIFNQEVIAGSRFITNQRDELTAKLEDDSTVTYEPAPFVAVPPNYEETSSLQLQVAIDNASRNLMEDMERLGSHPSIPIVVIYRVYLSDDHDTVQNNPPLKLDVTSVTAGEFAVTFNAGLTNLRKKPFPAIIYTVDQYPGLAR